MAGTHVVHPGGIQEERNDLLSELTCSSGATGKTQTDFEYWPGQIIKINTPQYKQCVVWFHFQGYKLNGETV